MPERRHRENVRQYPKNGLKFILKHAVNVRELLERSCAMTVTSEALKKCGVMLDRKQLADIAVRDVTAFDAIVAQARTAI